MVSSSSELFNEDGDALNLALMNYVHLYITGFVNKPNMRYWAPVNPTELHEQPLHSPEVTALCGVKLFRWLDHFSLKNDSDENIRFAVERYAAMLRNFLFPKLEALSVDPNKLFFPTRQSDSTHCEMQYGRGP